MSIVFFFRVTLFAYGQSGSGKSYTFFGKEPEMYNFEKEGTKRVRKERADIELPPEDLYGLIPRSLTYVFQYFIDNVRYIEAPVVRVGFYEIYNNQLYDLLTTLQEVKLLFVFLSQVFFLILEILFLQVPQRELKNIYR